MNEKNDEDKGNENKSNIDNKNKKDSNNKSRLDKIQEIDEGFNFLGIAAIYKTEKLNEIIDLIARKAKKFWKIYFTLGIPASIITMAYIFIKTSQSAGKTVGSGAGGAEAKLVIPGITTPLAAGIIGVITVMFVHEFSHGIAAKVSDIPVKGTGLFLLLILPGAYVEPDEEAMEEARLRDRLRVYGAGSFSNIVFGFGFWGLLLGLFNLAPVTREILRPFGTILEWIIILNVGIGFMNLFPIYPLDGGHITKDILEELTTNKWVVNIVTGTISVVGIIVIGIGLINGVLN